MSETFGPLNFQSVELHDEVIRFEQVGHELRAYVADGSYYVVGVSDQHKLVAYLGRDQLNA